MRVRPEMMLESTLQGPGSGCPATTKTAPVSSGIAEKKSCSALALPADAPIATIGGCLRPVPPSGVASVRFIVSALLAGTILAASLAAARGKTPPAPSPKPRQGTVGDDLRRRHATPDCCNEL